MAFKGLSVNVSGDSGSAVASLQTLKSQLSGTKRDANDAGDSVEELGDSASTASAQLGALSGSAATAAGSVGLLGRRSQRGAAGFGVMASKATALAAGLTVVSAAAVPLTATLGAMATAAGGVAAGFGAVIGTGMFAYGEQLAGQNEERLQQIDQKIAALEQQREQTGELTDAQQQQLDKLRQTREEVAETTTATGALSEELKPAKEQFRESALALGQDFIPLMRDTIDALPEFIRRIENSVGNLQPFADALRDAGQAGMTVIPALVEQMMDMGRDALPAVRRLGSFLADNAVPALQAMAETGDQVTSMLPSLGSSAANALPKINEFGLSILETTVPALRDAGGAITDLTAKFNALDSRTKNLSIGGALSAPAVAGVVAKLTMINPILGGIAGGVAALGAAYVANFAGMREKTDEVIDTAQELADDAAPAVKDLADQAADAGETVADELSPAVDDARGALSELKRGNFGAAFEELETGASEAMTGVRQLLVGSSGSGGLTATVSDAVTGAQEYLQGPGAQLLEKGGAEASEATINGLGELKYALIGPNGKSGILTEMVDQGTMFITETAPTLFGEATEAIGTGIRKGLIDMTNPLRGEESEIWGLLQDGATFLIDNGPQLFVGAGEALLNGLISGFQGLVRGLVGAENGEIWTALKKADERLASHAGSLMSGVGPAISGAIGDAIKDTMDFKETIGDELSELPSVEDIKEDINGIGESINDAIDDVIKDAMDFKETIGDELSELPSVEEIKEDINGIGSNIVSAIGDKLADAGDFGGAIRETITSSINDAIESLNEAAPSPTVTLPNEDKGLPGPLPEVEKGQIVDRQLIPESPFPKLNTGGFIEESGFAEVHEGERVVPAAEVDRDGGGSQIVIEELHASGRRAGREAGKALKDELRRQDVR